MPNIERQDEFIRSLGVEAYRVGGSVRDEILGRPPKDADYIVRGMDLDALRFRLRVCTPGEKSRIAPLKDRQGQQFGWRCNGIEISLPRKEENAGSGRKQRIVVDPDLPLSEDAERRDFTFNALYRRIHSAYESWMGVVDPTGTGIDDLRRRIIRTTHPDSFRDDPLRMLRALRFVSTLDADLAEETWAQMCVHSVQAEGLTHKGYTSGTVFDEFSKLLMGQYPAKALRIAASETSVLPVVMPELADMIGFEQGSRYHDLTVDEHTFKAIDTASKVDAPLRVRWALLFHDSGKPDSAWTGRDGRYHYYASPRKEFDPHNRLDDETWERVKTEDHEVVSEHLWRAAAKRMNVPRRFTDDVATLIREHMVPVQMRNPETKIARMRVKLGDGLLRDLLMHRMCDLAGKGTSNAVDPLLRIGSLAKLHREMMVNKVPASIKDLEINGHDCKTLGYEGKLIGDTLAAVLDEVVCDPSPLKRSREWQLQRAGHLARITAK